jgi:hypothetical protein
MSDINVTGPHVKGITHITLRAKSQRYKGFRDMRDVYYKKISTQHAIFSEG